MTYCGFSSLYLSHSCNFCLTRVSRVYSVILCVLSTAQTQFVHSYKDSRVFILKWQKHRQCTYNVTLRRVQETNVASGKSNKYYAYLRVSVCVRACACVDQCMCVCALMREGVDMFLSACSLTYPACNAYRPYCRLRTPGFTLFLTLSHKRQDFRKNSYWT